MPTRVSVRDIGRMKREGRKITMLTAYDAAMARLLAGQDVDMLLVGDSLGMVVLGYEATVPVTMAEMIHHGAAVRRGAPDCLVVVDLPFGSYQVSPEQAVRNGIRLYKETGCDAVKLEGGRESCAAVAALVRAGLSVMGHIGLTPQTAGRLGGFKAQGRERDEALRLVREARALEEAGVFSLVAECVPAALGGVLARAVGVPVIGIGAGPDCDGQVLVTHDLLGLYDTFVPRFVKRYQDGASLIRQGVETYCSEVRSGRFPAREHCFTGTGDFADLLEGA